MKNERLDEGVYRTVGDNGLTVLSELMPGVRSVAVGIWVKSASAHEVREKMGVSHMLEHMVFKGTKKRSAREIALALESRGGALDAFTSRDHTAYQSRVLDEDLPRALDVLTDLVRDPVLRGEDLELERKVVLEEISMVEDTPDDLVFEMHSELLWPDHPYGFSILGTRESVMHLATEDLRELHGRAYHPNQVVVAASGSLHHDVLLKLLGKCGWFGFEPGPEARTVDPVPSPERSCVSQARDGAQTHIVIGRATFGYSDERRYALLLLNTVLGGGMSSRLFQRVREELGLAYSIYSFQSFYRDSGVTGVYVGTHPSTAEEAEAAIRSQLERMSREGLPREDLTDAKQQLRGQVTLALESPVSRMNRLAGLTLYDEPYRAISEVLERIDAVTAEEVAQVAEEFMNPERHSVVRLGPN